MSVFIIRALGIKNGNRDDRGRFLLGSDDFTYTAGQLFEDVPPTHLFYRFIQKMRDLVVTSGCTTTRYCPDDPNTRGQISVFLLRGLFSLWEGRQERVVRNRFGVPSGI